MAREDGPDRLALGARQHDLEAALARIAEASDSARHAGDPRAHMREIGERPQRLDLADSGKRLQARRTLQRQDRGISAEIVDRSGRTGRGLQLGELVADAAEYLEPLAVEAPDREIATDAPGRVDAQRVADAPGNEIVNPPRRQFGDQRAGAGAFDA